MATIKELPSGAFQIRVVSKLLPKPYYATFETKAQAVAFSNHLVELLSKGIVPATLGMDKGEVRASWSVKRCIAEYLRSESPPVSEVKLLDTIRDRVPNLTTSELNYNWAEAWIVSMKRSENLAPSTIRHRHGALARCLDWVCRRHPQILSQNPLRFLKRGFATYTREDGNCVARNGGKLKVDVERDRRLDRDEEERILSSLNDAPEERLLFVLALETAMRMRECYTLGVEQLGFAKRTIHLQRTKNGDGREVPMTSTIARLLDAYVKENAKAIKAREGRLFSYWSGDLAVHALDATTVEVSLRFKNIFRRAGVKDFRFHDIRHEATCRLYEKTTVRCLDSADNWASEP